MREHVKRLRAAFDEMLRLRPRAEAWIGDRAGGSGGEPPIHRGAGSHAGSGGPPEQTDEWGPGHVLAHAAEMLPYWLGEIERVLDDPRDPAPFGRVKTDPVRVGIIERDHSLPIRELYSRIAAEIGRVCTRLAELTEADAAKVCVHQTLGQMTAEKLVEEFLSGHLEEHAAQLRAVVVGAAR